MSPRRWPQFINNPREFHKRSAEAKFIAERMSDIPSREHMMRVAREYEALAKRIEFLNKNPEDK